MDDIKNNMQDSFEIQTYMRTPLDLLHKRYNRIRRNYYLFGIIPIRNKLRISDERKLKKLRFDVDAYSMQYSSRHPDRMEMNAEAIEIGMSITKLLQELR